METDLYIYVEPQQHADKDGSKHRSVTIYTFIPGLQISNLGQVQITIHVFGTFLQSLPANAGILPETEQDPHS
jgi:hypothetical protein